jgi:hypothetical protein
MNNGRAVRDDVAERLLSSFPCSDEGSAQADMGGGLSPSVAPSLPPSGCAGADR